MPQARFGGGKNAFEYVLAPVNPRRAPSLYAAAVRNIDVLPDVDTAVWWANDFVQCVSDKRFCQAIRLRDDAHSSSAACL